MPRSGWQKATRSFSDIASEGFLPSAMAFVALKTQWARPPQSDARRVRL